jgi:plasmid maintenance system antidote protein VapI
MGQPSSYHPRNLDALRDAVYSHGYDGKSLGQAVGVSKQHVSLILTGRRGCSRQVAALIATALGGREVGQFFVRVDRGKPMAAMSGEEDNNKEEIMITKLEDPILDFKETCIVLKLSPGLVRGLRQNGEGPPFHRTGRKLKIRLSEAEDWYRDKFERTSS